MKTVTPSSDELKELIKGSACTMLGYILDELSLYVDELIDNDFVEKDVTIFQTTSNFVNKVAHTHLQEDLNIFSIKLEDMKNIPKFSVGLRFQRGYRWLDDIVDNGRRI